MVNAEKKEKMPTVTPKASSDKLLDKIQIPTDFRHFTDSQLLKLSAETL